MMFLLFILKFAMVASLSKEHLNITGSGSANWFTSIITIDYFKYTGCNELKGASFGDDWESEGGWHQSKGFTDNKVISVIAEGSYCRAMNLTHHFIDLWHQDYRLPVTACQDCPACMVKILAYSEGSCDADFANWIPGCIELGKDLMQKNEYCFVRYHAAQYASHIRVIYDESNPTCDTTLDNAFMVYNISHNLAEHHFGSGNPFSNNAGGRVETHRCQYHREMVLTHNDMSSIDLVADSADTLPWAEWAPGSLFLAFADDNNRDNDFEHVEDMCTSVGRVMIQWWIQPDLCFNRTQILGQLDDLDSSFLKSDDEERSVDREGWNRVINMDMRVCNPETMHTEYYKHRNDSLDGTCASLNAPDRTGRAILPYCHHYQLTDDEYEMGSPGDARYNDDVYGRSNDDYDDKFDDNDDYWLNFAERNVKKNSLFDDVEPSDDRKGKKNWGDDEYMWSRRGNSVIMNAVISKAGCCTSDVSKCYSYRNSNPTIRDYSYNGPDAPAAVSDVNPHGGGPFSSVASKSVDELLASAAASKVTSPSDAGIKMLREQIVESAKRFEDFLKEEESNAIAGQAVHHPYRDNRHFDFEDVVQTVAFWCVNQVDFNMNNHTNHSLDGISVGLANLNFTRLVYLKTEPIYTTSSFYGDYFEKTSKQVNFAKCTNVIVRIHGNNTGNTTLHFAYGCFDNFEQTGVFHSFWFDSHVLIAGRGRPWDNLWCGSELMFPQNNASSERPFTGDDEIITVLQQQELSGKVQVTYRTEKLGDSNLAECGGELKIHQIEYTTDSCRYGNWRVKDSVEHSTGDWKNEIWVSNVCDGTTNRNYFGAWHGPNCSGEILRHVSLELRDCSNRAWYINDDSQCDDDWSHDCGFDTKSNQVRHSDDDYDDYRLSDDDLNRDDTDDTDDEYRTKNGNVRAQFNEVQCCSSNLDRCFPNAPTASPTSHPTSKPTTHPTSNPTTHPTSKPTVSPTMHPTSKPTQSPVFQPTPSPTIVLASQTIMTVPMTVHYITTDYQGRRLETSAQFTNDQVARVAACQAVLLAIENVHATCKIGTIGADDSTITPMSFPVEFEISVVLELMGWVSGNFTGIAAAMTVKLQAAITSGAYSSFYELLTGNELLVNANVPVSQGDPSTPSSASTTTTSIVLPAALGAAGGFLLICLVVFLLMRQRSTNSQQQVHMEMGKR